MCAISGVIGLPAETGVLDAMLRTMTHRGPDGCGVYQQEEASLLHARLTIIDPEGGSQPMRLNWAGEGYCLIYNGELYNTEELRHELLKLGHRFLGHSDTEVVLHAYAQFGAACVDRLNGIFAFAVWEEQRRRLFMARDRIGVKPLFYMLHGNGLLFGSEIKTILKYPGVEAQLDEEGAAQLILLGPGRLPGSGIFRGIREIEPACCGYWEEGKLNLSRYWRLKDREHRESFEETVECVQYLIKDAILRQMVSDMPLGTFLSGGLDSSIITAVCAAEMERQGKKLKTFSVDYQDSERFFTANRFQPDSDNTYIQLLQKQLGTEHHWTVLSPEELADTLEEATEARDLPGMADVDFSLLAFCKRVRGQVKVALSGECADEIFGGYPWYRDPEVRAREGFPWAQNTAQRAELLNPCLTIDSRSFVMDAYRKACLESDILPGCSPLERRMKEMVNLNFRYFMQTLLDRKDRMSMGCSLEVRVPFCDYRIAEYLYGVPWEYKDYQGREKGLLRHAAVGLLPEQILRRKKSPYPKTFDPRYAQLMEARLGRILEDKNAPLWQILRQEKVLALLQEESQWPWYGQLMRGPQTMAYFCQINYWMQRYQVSFCF